MDLDKRQLVRDDRLQFQAQSRAIRPARCLRIDRPARASIRGPASSASSSSCTRRFFFEAVGVWKGRLQANPPIGESPLLSGFARQYVNFSTGSESPVSREQCKG